MCEKYGTFETVAIAACVCFAAKFLWKRHIENSDSDDEHDDDDDSCASKRDMHPYSRDVDDKPMPAMRLQHDMDNKAEADKAKCVNNTKSKHGLKVWCAEIGRDGKLSKFVRKSS
jgi:hypothetical protein